MNLGLFTDFGTVGKVDNVIRVCTPNTISSQGTCDKDNLAFRASAGISLGWQSPFGPIQIGTWRCPISKPAMTGLQIIHLSTATGF